MESFHRLTGIAAPLPVANVDTDMILPARFMKTVSRRGLGKGLFHAVRFDANGNERPDFILNQLPWRNARILVVRENFGCGSSREHAPWALLDFGIRCVIAESFAEIFYGNCFKNGILPVILSKPDIEWLLALSSNPATGELTVDLERQLVMAPGKNIAFDIDAQRRERLLVGADDITLSLEHGAAVGAHEERVRYDAPWLADAHLDQPGIWAPRAIAINSERSTND